MSVLVTGAGLVGSQVASKLVTKDETAVLYDVAPRLDYLTTVLDLSRVKVVVGDILDMARLVDTIKSNNVDRIIHTAAFLSDFMTMLNRPYQGFKINLLGTATVLEAARIMGVKKVILSSSSAVYMTMLGTPEDKIYREDFPMKPVTTWLPWTTGATYSVAKVGSEGLGLIYSEAYGVDCVALRYTYLFGPWRGSAAGTGGRMMDKLVRSGVFGKPVVIDPSLTAAGEFLYSKDAAEANIAACFAEKLPRRAYNISMAKPYEFKEVLDTVRKVFPNIKIKTKDIPKAGVTGFPPAGYRFDISNAQRDLGYKPYDLERAIRDFADWVKRNESPGS
jgi:nucleoside-diphosphate-sugar epimerase